MSLNLQGSLSHCNGLFHISENPGIRVFEPRPSPSRFEAITGDVVFAISGNLLHNYLLPRECPRVSYYIGAKTTDTDIDRFIGSSNAKSVIVVESGWYRRISETTLYCYEFSTGNFALLDECAGYYISYSAEIPIGISQINNIIGALLSRDIELRFTPNLVNLADSVLRSSLNFSLIRMRNAKGAINGRLNQYLLK